MSTFLAEWGFVALALVLFVMSVERLIGPWLTRTIDRAFGIRPEPFDFEAHDWTVS